MSNGAKIEPRTLKGFRDYLPALMIPREHLLQTARTVYRRYGFLPIDTPALEYAEILLGKGGAESDKLVYRFTDHGGRDVALRFDLTVPFARFAAQHAGQLGTPFKRYAMGPVWRGENTGHGRYREFWQCDFDTIGTVSVASDAETLLVIHDLLDALGVGGFSIRINHRQVLNGLLEKQGLAAKSVEVLRALDKLPKVGRDGVIAEMAATAQASTAQAEAILTLAGLEGDPTRLREVLAVASQAGVAPGRVSLDLSIARGLDYYTGLIFESFLDKLPGIGSVCSGGRYDDLAGLYTKQTLPGVGASLGVDRLLAALEELGLLAGKALTADLLVLQFENGHLGSCYGLARQLHAEGVGAEVFPEARKLGQQLQHAEKRGFRLAAFAGPDEREKGLWKLKDLSNREEQLVPEAELAAVALAKLGRA
jgi:histidyl-tRNA synthetase